MKTIKFYTLGCKVNQYDAQSIREYFLRKGLREINNRNPADVYVVNTCTVTQRADSDSLNFIRRAHQENPRAKIIVSGCLAKLDEDKIKNACPKSAIIKGRKFPARPISFFKGHTRAFLKIQDGCDNFCSYCKVPLVRGRPQSKSLASIVREAGQLVKNGFKEIVLCGICLGKYGRGLRAKNNLVDVISALEKIEGLSRIRLSSIEAGDVTRELVNKMAKSKKLCRHLHIPIQSGDNQVLKQMHRAYTRENYLSLIRKIKKKIPQVAITTDCLIGFPTENEENFQNTLSLIKKIMPLKTHIFPYSLRPGTAAAKNFKQIIHPGIIKKRLARLKEVSDQCALDFKKRFLGKNMQVLFESRAKDDAGYWEGHTDNYLKVRAKSSRNLHNKLVSVKLERIEKDYMAGSSKNFYA